MRTRITLFLLAANVVLFGFIFYLHYQGHPDRKAREHARKVFGPEASNLTFLEVRLGENEPRVLQRRNETSNWDLKSPVQWPANPFAVNRMLSQIEFLEKKVSFRAADLERTGQDLAQYGLEEPRAVLTFGRGSQRHKVRIGAPTDMGDRLYILDPNEEWVHVVAREFFDSLSLPLTEVQSDTVFNIPLFEVRSLNLQFGAHSKVRLARDESNWSFETPFQTGADPKAVEAVINRLNQLKIREFIGAESADHGLNNPPIRITLDGNARRQTLLVGNQASNGSAPDIYYAKLAENPTVFTIEADSLKSLENAQDLLRDRKLLQVSPADLSSVKIEIPDGADVLLQRLETDQWQIVSRYADQSVRILPADTDLVNRVLSRLFDAHILRFENDAPSDGDLNRYGFNPAQRIITLGGDDDVALLLGAHVPDSNGRAIFAKLSNSPFVYTVDASLLREAPASTQHFRDRLLLPQPDGVTISSIRIRNLDTNEIVFEHALPSPETEWEQVAADLPEEEKKALLELVPAVRNLRVQHYVQDGFTPTISMDGEEVSFSYALEAELLLVGGETPRRQNLEILLTEPLGGQTLLGGSRSLNVIFSVRQNLIDALGPLLFDRAKPKDEVTMSTRDN